MQQAHFTVTDSPADIAASYSPGTYLAQLATIADGAAGVLYGTAMTAPTDDADYFVANSINPLFQFSSGTGNPDVVQGLSAGVELHVGGGPTWLTCF